MGTDKSLFLGFLPYFLLIPFCPFFLFRWLPATLLELMRYYVVTGLRMIIPFHFWTTSFFLLQESSRKFQVREGQTCWATESPGKILIVICEAHTSLTPAVWPSGSSSLSVITPIGSLLYHAEQFSCLVLYSILQDQLKRTLLWRCERLIKLFA